MKNKTKLVLTSIRSFAIANLFVSVALAFGTLLAGCQAVSNGSISALSTSFKSAKQDFMAGKWKAAAEGFEHAMEQGGDNADKAACAILAARSWACVKGQQQRAAELMDEAARLCPKNKEVAAMRLAAWSATKDENGIQNARAHLIRCDLRLTGEPVCEPVTGLVIITCVTLAAVTWWIYSIPQNERALIVEKAIDCVAAPLAHIAL